MASCYGDVLKNLLSFSNTKFIILGNYLGYDVSYISKWCNNVKLPSEKSIKEINEQISSLISEEIIQQKKVDSFFKEFQIELPKNKAITNEKIFLKDKIYSILEKTYEQKQFLKEDEKENICKNECNLVITDRNQIKQFLREDILKNIVYSSEDINILISMDLRDKDCIELLSLISSSKPKDISINISLGLSLDEEEISSSELKKIYLTLNRFSNLHIKLYNDRNFSKLNFFSMDKKLAFMYSRNSSGEIEAIARIKDKIQIEKIYSLMKNSILKEDRIFSIKSTESLLKKSYRTNFYTDNSFNFFLVTGFEFLLPESIINNILCFAKEKGYPPEDIFNLKKLMITWDEMFEKSSINFFITKSSIMRYFQERILYFINIEYKISPEEIKAQYNYLINLIKLNEKIKFYIVDDEILAGENVDFKVSVFANSNLVFLKNLTLLHEKGDNYVFPIKKKENVKSINKTFDIIKSKNYCTHYSTEEIEERWEKYKGLIFRIMDIIL